MARFADGVIVGSAFVRRLLEARRAADGIAAVADLAAELAAAVRSPAARPCPGRLTRRRPRAPDPPDRAARPTAPAPTCRAA